MNQTIELLMRHHSVRKYEPRAVSEDVKEQIIRCAQMAPTSSYFQAYTIIEIKAPESRKVLAEAAGGQEWVVKAPLVLLFCADLNRGKNLLKVKEQEVFGNVECYTVAVVDAALAMQKAFVAAQSLGLEGVVVGGIRNDMERIKKVAELPKLVMPLCLLCLGYPAEYPPVKPRLPLELIWKKDRYGREADRDDVSRYDELVGQYFSELTNGEDAYTWTERCAHALAMKPRYQVGDFAKEEGFLQK